MSTRDEPLPARRPEARRRLALAADTYTGTHRSPPARSRRRVLAFALVARGAADRAVDALRDRVEADVDVRVRDCR